MALTAPTESEVEEIMGPVDFDLSPFITIANELVGDRLEDEINAGTVSDTILDYLQRYLAAHFSTVREGQITGASISDGPNVDYMRRSQGPGLMSTDYGQNAVALDPTGKINTSTTLADFKSFDVLNKDYV